MVLDCLTDTGKEMFEYFLVPSLGFVVEAMPGATIDTHVYIRELMLCQLWGEIEFTGTY